jgi:thiamine biosynthesis lipoprotein
MASVTVVADDPAMAEVWSKTLFLAGANGIAEAARQNDQAALWVTADGIMRQSPAMDEHVLWREAQ